MHKHNVIHGDLALRNVLVQTRGNVLSCAICDFGLAHHKNKIKHMNKIPARWAAPEVLKNKR